MSELNQATPVYLIPLHYPNIVVKSAAEDIARAALAVELALVTADKAVARADGDKNLTASGRREVISSDLSAIHEDFKTYTEPVLDSLVKAVDRLEGALLAPQINRQMPEGADPAITTAVAVNLLSNVGAMNEPERQAEYLDAASSGDVAKLATLEQARLIDDATITKGREIFAEAASPEQYGFLEQTRGAVRIIRGNLVQVERTLREAVPVGPRTANKLADAPLPAIVA